MIIIVTMDGGDYLEINSREIYITIKIFDLLKTLNMIYGKLTLDNY